MNLYNLYTLIQMYKKLKFIECLIGKTYFILKIFY